MLDKLCFTIVLMKDAPKSLNEAIRQKQGVMIRQLRRMRKLSQSQLADRLTVTKAAVSDWERGVSTPRRHLQVALSVELETPWSVLFGLDGEAISQAVA